MLIIFSAIFSAGLTITLGKRVYLVGVQIHTQGKCGKGSAVFTPVQKLLKEIESITRKDDFPCQPKMDVRYLDAKALQSDGRIHLYKCLTCKHWFLFFIAVKNPITGILGKTCRCGSRFINFKKWKTVLCLSKTFFNYDILGQKGSQNCQIFLGPWVHLARSLDLPHTMRGSAWQWTILPIRFFVVAPWYLRNGLWQQPVVLS